MDIWKEYPDHVQLNDGTKISRVEDCVRALKVPDERLEMVADAFAAEMKRGLEDGTTGTMLNTYVTDVLNGTEKGEYLAIDLGGSNLRILRVLLHGEGSPLNTQGYSEKLPPYLRQQPVAQLFDYIASSLYRFEEKNNRLNRIEAVPLGFSFSFGMWRDALDSGKLTSWGKSFNCPDGIGEDVGKLLMDAINRKQGLHIRLMAVINDCTGILVAASHQHQDTQISLGLGTGCNSCYFEGLDRIQYPHNIPRHKANRVIINTESGSFGTAAVMELIRTPYDVAVDEETIDPGVDMFEKLFSGHYIGEIVRQVVVDLCRRTLMLTKSGSTQKLDCKGAITSADVSSILSDGIDDGNNNAQQLMIRLGLEPEADDVAILRYVAELVSIRGAYLVASQLSTVVRRFSDPELIIAVDGSLYEKHPTMSNYIKSKLQDIVPNVKCNLVLVKDGPCLGAAFAAAVAVRLLRN